MKKMILYFNNGSGLGVAKSGGTARHIEIAKRLKLKGVECSIVTTSGAFELYSNENFLANKFFVVKSSLLKKVETNNLDRMVSYFISTVHSLFLLFKLPLCDIVYSTSDYFCDVIPSFFYKALHKKATWVAMIHHLCKSPFRRKGNFFINSCSFVFQRISFVFIKLLADKVLVYDTPEGRNIAQLILGTTQNTKLYYVANGIDTTKINSLPDVEPKYDVCFAGGLRVTKGIFDLLPIIKSVKEKFPTLSVLVAGAGTTEVENDFRKKLTDATLQDNVILLGPLNSMDLYSRMKESRVFISTSHEEGWGIAICEAMACGLPVLVYLLPAFKYLEGYINEVNLFDYDSFSSMLITLLNNSSNSQLQGQKNKDFIQRFDWDNISDKEFDILTK